MPLRQWTHPWGSPIEQPLDNYTFQEAEVQKSSYQLSTGLTYTFNTYKKVRPSLSIGYGVLKQRPYEVIYSFFNPQLQTDYQLVREINPQMIQRNILIVGGQADYDITSYTKIFCGLRFRKYLGEELNGPISLLGIHAGFKFIF